MLADWMAAPAVPLTRLSRAVIGDDATRRLVDGETDERGVGAQRVRGAREFARRAARARTARPRRPPRRPRGRSRRSRPAASLAVEVARMPRDIGTSIGVNETVDARAARDGQVLVDLRGVPMGAADGVRGRRAQDLAGDQLRLRGLARARRADGEDRRRGHPARPRPRGWPGASPRVMARHVAAGNGDALGARRDSRAAFRRRRAAAPGSPYGHAPKYSPP